MTYRNNLPQLGDALYITDGGIETTLMFNEGFKLPDFAAFHLLQTPAGELAIRRYFRRYAEIAKRFGTGFILESPTWRASADWGTRLGYRSADLAGMNRRALMLCEDIRSEYKTARTPVVVSGCIGPRGDGYVPDSAMSELAAASYHQAQIDTIAESNADMVCAITMNHVEEVLGIVRAARRANMPVAISFVVETDGRLPSGQSLKAAIEQVDEATSAYPCYYMINCAHPTHFDHLLAGGDAWLERIRGLRANASCKSHAELNESTQLDSGNPVELGAQYASLKKQLPWLSVMGGCCGTDHRHVERIAEFCTPLFAVT